MPGPIVKDKLSGYRSWVNEEPSVFDPLYEQVARRVLKETGMDAPETNLMGGDLTSPLVSMYKDKAARSVGTNDFVQRAMDFPSAGREALLGFAKKYPRIAAHMKPALGPVKMMAGKEGEAEIIPTVGKVKEQIPTTFSKSRSEKFTREDMDNFIHHEGTHVAQLLGNSNMARLYSLWSALHSNDEIYGYVTNPFEIAAKRAEPGSAAMRNIPGYKGNAISNLRDRSEGMEQQLINLRDKVGTSPAAAQVIDEKMGILENILETIYGRSKRGWEPGSK